MTNIPKNIQEYAEKIRESENRTEFIKISSRESVMNERAEKKNLERELKKAQIEIDKAEAQQKINKEMSDLIEVNNLYQTGAGKLSWWKKNDKGEWFSVFKDSLVGSFPILANPANFIEFTKLMNEKDRVIDKTVLSWTQPTGNRILNQLEKRFIQADPSGKTDYHWMINAVFHSICGGSAESIESLEKTIYAKYLHPENFMLPNPFFNDGGETGKGLFVEQFIGPLFGGQIASNADMAHITGTYNKSISGKAVIFVNETVKESVAVDRLKAFLGSPTFMVNEKYQPVITADNTALVIGATNDKAGAIMLGGNGADRRFSIFSSKSNLNEVVLNLLVEKEGFKLSAEIAEIRHWIKTVGQVELRNQVSIGKWLNAMQEKYGDVLNVEPHHGEDYHAQLDRQRAAWTESVERVFTDPNFTYIRNNTMIRLIKEFNQSERNIPGKKKMREVIEELIQKKKLDIEFDPLFKCHHNGISTSATVWRKSSLVWVKSNNLDEKRYGTDENGRWTWNWIE